MTSDLPAPGVWIDILLDGRPVRTVRLDAALAAGAADGLDAGPDPAPTRRRVSVTLPADGKLRLTVDLRRACASEGSVLAGPLVKTVEYRVPPGGVAPGSSGCVSYGFDASGLLNAIIYGDADSESPPDEPHVAC